MRPAGEIRKALYDAAKEFSAVGGASLAELAAKACVSRDKASECVTSMRRAGVLNIVADRRVSYRNRPVAVYMPAKTEDVQAIQQGWVDLNNCMSMWANR